MTIATRVRDECQRLVQEYLTANPAAAERLREGDTLSRYAAFADARNYAIRHYPHGDMEWYDWQVTRQEIVRHVEELCKSKVAPHC